MKILIIIGVVVALGIAGFVGAELGVFDSDPEREPYPIDNSYIPKDVVEEKPTPFQVLPAGGAPIEIYDGVTYGSKITSVDLSGRGLEGSLKAEVRQLSVLVELDLSNNAFTGLPAEIGQLSGLQILNLANNELTGIPHELGNLQNLITLDLRGNDISEFDLEVITEQLASTTQVLVD